MTCLMAATAAATARNHSRGGPIMSPSPGSCGSTTSMGSSSPSSKAGSEPAGAVIGRALNLQMALKSSKDHGGCGPLA